ncbi:unnamed protein product [Diplocarpon coronariae]
MDPGHNQAQFCQQMQTPSFQFNPNNTFRRDHPPRSFPTFAVNPHEMSMNTEVVGLGMWPATTPQSAQRTQRPRPATIHETGFAYCLPEEYSSLPAWDSSTMPMQPLNDGLAQTYPAPQDFYPATPHGEIKYEDQAVEPFENLYLTPVSDGWQTKPCDEGIDLQGLDTDMHLGQAYTADESAPILDLRYPGPEIDRDRLNLEQSYNARRLSGSSFTMSTSGALSEMPSYEDFSATLSEAPSFSSDYPPLSNRNSLMSSTQLSPVASPRMTPQHRSELVRTQSRGRASPSPRPSMRSAPYTMDSTRSKRWSTGSYATMPTRRPSPFVYHQGHELFTALPPRMSSRHSSPTLPNAQLPLNVANLQQTPQHHPFVPTSNTAFHPSTMLLPSHTYHEPHQFEAPPPLLSHGLFRLLQSNADPHALHPHYADLSDPPDLYASLQEEQIPPPPEDMNPSDPDLTPHEQELRFDGDLYTPRWVRGHGNKREGWCGICKPGRWLSFTHGISAATGSPFQEPQETRRMDGNPDVWEGLCGSCHEWVALVSSKKKGTTWFRHAYKCHTHPKIKDAPKRRRESSHTRIGASTIARPKMEPPVTPQMTPSSSATCTPTTGMLSLSHRKTTSPLSGRSTMT